MRLPSVLVAILLVLIIPLEQGRCACGNPGSHAKQAPAAAAAAEHCGGSCCGSSAAAHGGHPGRPGTVPEGCACASYSAGVLPMAPSLAGDAYSVVAFAPLPSAVSVEPVSEPREHPPALDVGSLSRPDLCGAHGLRAPPVAA